jgi:hypothetical protein
LSNVYSLGRRSRELDESAELVLRAPDQWQVLWRDVRNSFATLFFQRLGAGNLRLGFALVVVDSYDIHSRCRMQCVRLRSLQAPSMIMDSNTVSGKLDLQPTPFVVRKSPSVSVLYPDLRYKR